MAEVNGVTYTIPTNRIVNLLVDVLNYVSEESEKVAQSNRLKRYMVL